MSKKNQPIDDGRVIADMNVKGMRGYVPEEQKEKRRKADSVNLTRKEKWALIKAAYLHAIPLLLLVGVCFLVAGGLMSLWLWLGS